MGCSCDSDLINYFGSGGIRSVFGGSRLAIEPSIATSGFLSRDSSGIFHCEPAFHS